MEISKIVWGNAARRFCPFRARKQPRFTALNYNAWPQGPRRRRRRWDWEDRRVLLAKNGNGSPFFVSVSVSVSNVLVRERTSSAGVKIQYSLDS